MSLFILVSVKHTPETFFVCLPCIFLNVVILDIDTVLVSPYLHSHIDEITYTLSQGKETTFDNLHIPLSSHQTSTYLCRLSRVHIFPVNISLATWYHDINNYAIATVPCQRLLAVSACYLRFQKYFWIWTLTTYTELLDGVYMRMRRV